MILEEKMKRKFLSLFIAVIMVATVLTACGGNKNKKEDQSNTKQSNSETNSKNNQSKMLLLNVIKNY